MYPDFIIVTVESYHSSRFHIQDVVSITVRNNVFFLTTRDIEKKYLQWFMSSLSFATSDKVNKPPDL